MAFTQPRYSATDPQSQIDELLRRFGRPSAESRLESSGKPFFYQATWICGCTIDYVHDEAGAYWWQACSGHSSFEQGA